VAQDELKGDLDVDSEKDVEDVDDNLSFKMNGDELFDDETFDFTIEEDKKAEKNNAEEVIITLASQDYPVSEHSAANGAVPDVDQSSLTSSDLERDEESLSDEAPSSSDESEDDDKDEDEDEILAKNVDPCVMNSSTGKQGINQSESEDSEDDESDEDDEVNEDTEAMIHESESEQIASDDYDSSESSCDENSVIADEHGSDSDESCDDYESDDEYENEKNETQAFTDRSNTENDSQTRVEVNQNVEDKIPSEPTTSATTENEDTEPVDDHQEEGGDDDSFSSDTFVQQYNEIGVAMVCGNDNNSDDISIGSQIITINEESSAEEEDQNDDICLSVDINEEDSASKRKTELLSFEPSKRTRVN